MQGAIEADKQQDYDEAYKLYSNALDYFMLALKCAYSFLPARLAGCTAGVCCLCCLTREGGSADEKNERSKKLIKSKFNEYLARAETLKEHIQSKEDKRAKKAVGVNGMNGGAAGGGKR